MELQLISGLGLPGLLFLVAFVFMQIALIELLKVVLAKAGRVVQGGAVILLSLGLGAGLGALMLSGVASRAGIELPRPWSGLALGLVLAAVASGWMAYRREQARAKGVAPDVLLDLMGQLAQAQLPVAPVVPAGPLPAPAPVTEELRPMTATDVAQTGVYEDVPLSRPAPAWLDPLGTTLLGIVSKAVVAGAPLLQDGNAERLVGLLFGVAWDRYVVPRLPLWLRPLAPVVYGIVVRGLEDLYRAVIKPPKPAPAPTP
ncbi:hypothetical protein ASF71_21440 [Deinococcus sp. Leaf326]|nr:hypothetical protein ASF71_21440 [Deinococcus sp. Leaf326]